MNLDYKIVRKRIRTALKEDKVGDDITSNFFCSSQDKVVGVIKSSHKSIVCGFPIIKELYNMLDANLNFSPIVDEGTRIDNEIIAEVKGPSKELLSTERIVLNFLSHLSGIATLTSKFVDSVKKYRVKIMDTRKTIPGLRHLEKYAVFIGGGSNHRINLEEMILLKDNHIKIVSKKGKKIKFDTVVNNLNKKYPHKKIEIEVENLTQLKEVILSYPDIIMLDNMDPPKIKKAVELKQKLAQKTNERIKNIELEASGGIDLKTVEEFARCGVDRISIGALTNSAPAVDFTMSIK